MLVHSTFLKKLASHLLVIILICPSGTHITKIHFVLTPSLWLVIWQSLVSNWQPNIREMMIDYVFHISTWTEFSLSKCIQKFQVLGMVNSTAIGQIGWYSYLSKSAWNIFLCYKTQALICDSISMMFEQMWPLSSKTWFLQPSTTNSQCSNQRLLCWPQI